MKFVYTTQNLAAVGDYHSYAGRIIVILFLLWVMSWWYFYCFSCILFWGMKRLVSILSTTLGGGLGIIRPLVFECEFLLVTALRFSVSNYATASTTTCILLLWAAKYNEFSSQKKMKKWWSKHRQHHWWYVGNGVIEVMPGWFHIWDYAFNYI